MIVLVKEAEQRGLPNSRMALNENNTTVENLGYEVPDCRISGGQVSDNQDRLAEMNMQMRDIQLKGSAKGMPSTDRKSVV